jgi:hypothetical protein
LSLIKTSSQKDLVPIPLGTGSHDLRERSGRVLTKGRSTLRALAIYSNVDLPSWDRQ